MNLSRVLAHYSINGLTGSSRRNSTIPYMQPSAFNPDNMNLCYPGGYYVQFTPTHIRVASTPNTNRTAKSLIGNPWSTIQ